MDPMVPGHRCQSSVGGGHRADTGRGVEPPYELQDPGEKDDPMSDAEADDGVRGGGVMAAPTIAPYRSPAPAGHDGFGQLLQAEWTKFRTVRGWVIG
jgi:hypothetical protein